MHAAVPHFALALALGTLIAPGCRGQANVDSGDVHLATLTNVFVYYLNTHRGDFPKDEAAFKSFITQTGQPWLVQAGVADDGDLFTSTHDCEPLVFIYGNKSDPRAARGVVGYERTGVAGLRLVGFRDGSVRRVDEAEFSRLTGT